MRNIQECLELRKLASYAKDIPPIEFWKSVQCKIGPEDWELTIFKWSFLARYLDAYSEGNSAPDISDFIHLEGNSIIFKGDPSELWNGARINMPDSTSAQKGVNLYKKINNANCNYYLQLSIMVFQAHKDILKVASEELGENISHKRSEIIKFIMLEEFNLQLAIFLSEFWESSAPSLTRKFLPQVPYLLKKQALYNQKVIPLEPLHPQIKKTIRGSDDREKLHKEIKTKLVREVDNLNNLNRINNLDLDDYWSKLCWLIFYENQDKYPNYNNWVNSISNMVRIVTSRKFPLRKHFYQNGKYYPSNNEGRIKKTS